MTAKEIILEQMAACRNEVNWFVPVSNALADLSLEHALLKDKSNNSIMQIVVHLIFWNERYLNRFKGISNPKFTGENKETFEASSLDISEIDLIKAKERLDLVLGEFYKAVRESEEDKLNSPAYEDKPEPWFSYLLHITIHNAYHIGQIITIRKQHGNWNSSLGVS